MTLDVALGEAARAHPALTGVADLQRRPPAVRRLLAVVAGVYSCTVSGLVNGEKHEYTARAVNAVGESRRHLVRHDVGLRGPAHRRGDGRSRLRRRPHGREQRRRRALGRLLGRHPGVPHRRARPDHHPLRQDHDRAPRRDARPPGAHHRADQPVPAADLGHDRRGIRRRHGRRSPAARSSPTGSRRPPPRTRRSRSGEPTSTPTAARSRSSASTSPGVTAASRSAG